MCNIRHRNHISAASRRASSATFIVHVSPQYVRTIRILILVFNGIFPFRKMASIFYNVEFAIRILLRISFSLFPSAVI